MPCAVIVCGLVNEKVAKFYTPNEMLGIEDGVGWVGVECIFDRVTDQSLIVREADP
jgi:hypothetical protein